MISIILLAVIYLAFLCLGFPDAMFGAAWPSMYGVLNVPLYYAGYITMIVAFGRVVASFFSAKIIKWFGTQLVSIVGAFAIASALFGYSFSASFLQISFWTIVLGLGAGLIDVAFNNYVALHYKAIYMNWLHCFWGIGASIGPMIMSFYLIDNNSWALGYRTVGIIQSCLVILLLVTLPLWGKNKTSIKVEDYKPKDLKYKEMFQIAGVKHILLVYFIYCAIQVIAALWGSSYLVTERNILPETAALWISYYFIGITLSRFLSGFLTIKLSNRQIIRLSNVVIGCGVIILIIPAGDILLASAFFILGFGCGPIYPCLLHETPKKFGSDKSHAIIGLQMASGFMGAIIVPPLFGQLASFISFSFYPIFLGLFLLIVAVTFEMGNKILDRSK